LTSGTPIEAAATSSSRTAIQARPSRESRNRKLMNRAIASMPRPSQKYGRRLNAESNWSKNGSFGWSTGEIAVGPFVSLWLAIGILILSPFSAIVWTISPKASVTIAM
jgi:hypothetical protein